MAIDLAEKAGKFWTLEPEPVDHYVYVLMDPRKPGPWSYTLPSGRRVTFSYQPFYVGKGKGGRYEVHFTASSLQKRNRKNSVIKAIRKAGLEVIAKKSSTTGVTDFDAQAYEIDLIAGIGRRDLRLGPLANMTDGGDGATGHSHPVSDAQKELLREIRLGTTASETTKAKMSAARLGVAKSEEHKRKIGLARKGKLHSAESKKKISDAKRGKPSALKGVPKSPEHVAQIRAKAKAEQGTVRCEHCGMMNSPGNAKRWHGDNCKQRS